MSNVPLPEPHHQSAANFNAPDEPFYTADQMHAHAAAVSAAKDAEIAQLRAELIKSLADNAALRADAIDRQNNVVAPLRERVRELTTQAMFNASTIERLRAEVAGLREDAERYHEWKRAFREGECALWNALCECQSDAEHDAAIDAALAARKGEATTPPPSPSPRS